MGIDTPLLLALPALPFAGFLLNALFGRLLPRRGAGILACVAVGLSAALAFGLTIVLMSARVEGKPFTADFGPWIEAGGLEVRFAFLLDALSAMMICIITGVGFLIHLYSTGYMAEDKAQPRYFAYLNLFVAMMLVLVLADNLALTFLGWEGVGLCSYLLIGFWFDDAAKAAAGLKAFIVNRIGDAGFVVGALAAWKAAGTLEYAGVNAAATTHLLSPDVLRWIVLGLFLGVCGKSAQIPLYTWLPDAMAGPTPVSALIHAATMVTAGVYLLCRMSPVVALCPEGMDLIANVGAATLLLAAVIACFQNDIKKVLAYSTVSQLGYMVLACGVGAFSAGAFHLATHAFFKACLFLGAGSVIHAMAGEQDIRKMGGLRKLLPWTHQTFLVAVLAISGIPPFSGFYSKDAVLWGVCRSGHGLLHFIGLAGAGLTAYYMTRLYVLTFRGELRSTAHPHESPSVMTGPLVVLATLAALGGFLGYPRLTDLQVDSGSMSEHASAALALLFAVGGMLLAWKSTPEDSRKLIAGPAERAFRVDEAYDLLVVRPLKAGAEALWLVVDRVLIDGILVGGTALAAKSLGFLARSAQSGYAAASLVYLLFGTLLTLWLMGIGG